MVLHVGDRVMVNMAPFIGWAEPTSESIACQVLAVEGARVEVQAEQPYRAVKLWVSLRWVEQVAAAGRDAAACAC